MKLDPDHVTGVDLNVIDPTSLTSLDALDRGGIPVGVTVEAHEDSFQFVALRP